MTLYFPSMVAVRAAPLLGAVCLVACAGPGSLKVGDPEELVRQRLGRPSGEHVLTSGERRLEYAAGAYGKQTYMVDVDAQGRLVRWENVLDEAHFNRIHAGMTREQLREQLGPPSRVWGVRYHDQTIWSYRYEVLFCQMFNVGITPQGTVEDTSFGPDPLCDDDNFLRRSRSGQ